MTAKLSSRGAALALALFASFLSISGSAAAWGAPEMTESSARSVPEPRINFDPIPYDKGRKRQMAAYSNRHYGSREWRLEDPEAIVLHYTATSTYPPVFNTFASNAPNLGESPGVCSQFVVDKDGTINQLTRLYVRCRHTVGLNHVSIGVEMVQEDTGDAEQTILEREDESRAAVKLVAWLKQRFGIPMKNIIGHATANDSPLFEDLEGWRNDHVDWGKRDVRDFRRRVAALIRDSR